MLTTGGEAVATLAPLVTVDSEYLNGTLFFTAPLNAGYYLVVVDCVSPSVTGSVDGASIYQVEGIALANFFLFPIIS